MSLVPKPQADINHLAKMFRELESAPGKVQTLVVQEATNTLDPLTAGQISELLKRNFINAPVAEPAQVQESSDKEKLAELVRGLNLPKYDAVDMNAPNAPTPKSLTVASVKPVVRDEGIV